MRMGTDPVTLIELHKELDKLRAAITILRKELEALRKQVAPRTE